MRAIIRDWTRAGRSRAPARGRPTRGRSARPPPRRRRRARGRPDCGPRVRADERDEPPAVLADCRRLAADLRRARLADALERVAGERTPGVCRKAVAGAGHAHFAGRCADVGAEVNPRDGLTRERRIAIEIRVQAEVPELVAARRDEMGRAKRARGGDRAQRLEPAHEAAAALGRVRVPAAARRHHADGREIRASSLDRRDDVVGRRVAPRGVCDDAHLRTGVRGAVQRVRVLAADLQHRRPEGLRERRRVDGTEPRPAAHRRDDDRAVRRTGPEVRERRLAVRRHARGTDRPIAARRSECAGHAAGGRERRVEHDEAVDAAALDLQELRDRIDARERKRLERRGRAGCARERDQAIRRRAIDGRRRAVKAFGGVAADDVPRARDRVVESIVARATNARWRRERQPGDEFEQLASRHGFFLAVATTATSPAISRQRPYERDIRT